MTIGSELSSVSAQQRIETGGRTSGPPRFSSSRHAAWSIATAWCAHDVDGWCTTSRALRVPSCRAPGICSSRSCDHSLFLVLERVGPKHKKCFFCWWLVALSWPFPVSRLLTYQFMFTNSRVLTIISLHFSRCDTHKKYCKWRLRLTVTQSASSLVYLSSARCSAHAAAVVRSIRADSM